MMPRDLTDQEKAIFAEFPVGTQVCLDDDGKVWTVKELHWGNGLMTFTSGEWTYTAGIRSFPKIRKA